MCNKIISVAGAADMVLNGATIMYGNFLSHGSARHIIEVLAQKDTKGLTTTGNDCGMIIGPNGEGSYGVAKLMRDHQAEYAIATHMGMIPDVGTQGMVDKTLTVDLISQGTLAEMIRADGADLDGMLTPADVGTIMEDSPFCLGKQTTDGRDYLLVEPIRADFALIDGYPVSKLDNIRYKSTTRSFNVVMATAADMVVVEVDNVVETGGIQPENVVTSGAFASYIVDGGNA